VKKLVVDCEHVIYPFGTGAPCCLEDVERTKDTGDLKQCSMQRCPKYKTKAVADEAKERKRLSRSADDL